jgi:hypothetical protein
MKKDHINDAVVVLDYPDNWVEFFEQDGHPALRVLPPSMLKLTTRSAFLPLSTSGAVARKLSIILCR